MAQSNLHKAAEEDRTIGSASALRWAEARHVMLTDNSSFDSQDPLRCMDLTISPWQVEHVQRCIKTLYQGLKWANLLNIRGGYVGQRSYGRLFLIDDPYIIGVFDDRNVLNKDAQTDYRYPRTLKELIQLYNQGKGNMKTLVVFEKPNLRLANSDEKARQSYFIAETIYPALAAIVQMLNQLEIQQNNYFNSGLSSKSTANSDEMQLAKISRSVSQNFLQLSPLFLGLFKDQDQTNKILLEKSPLQFFYSANSPLNLDIDDDFFAESISNISDAMETDT